MTTSASSGNSHNEPPTPQSVLRDSAMAQTMLNPDAAPFVPTCMQPPAHIPAELPAQQKTKTSAKPQRRASPIRTNPGIDSPSTRLRQVTCPLAMCMFVFCGIVLFSLLGSVHDVLKKAQPV